MADSTMTTPTTARAWLPEQVGDLLLVPVERDSVAVQAAGSVRADETSHMYRVPRVAADPSAAWTAEAAEIPATAATLDEASSGYFKLAGLTVVSNELVADSAPAALQAVTRGLARDTVAKLDAAFFGARGDNTLQPLGLGDLKGVNTVAAGTSIKNLDPFLAAIAAAETVGATLNAFVANPDDALALAQLKAATGSNLPLLGDDPTQPGKRLIAGVQLLVSPAVAKGVIWGVPGGGRATVVIRKDTELVADKSVYFTSDRTAVRSVMRVGTVFAHEQAVQKIKLG